VRRESSSRRDAGGGGDSWCCSRHSKPALIRTCSWAFSEAAHFAIRYHDVAKRFYQRKLAKTNGIVGVRALAHKLARASYYVMRDKVEFNPDRLFASRRGLGREPG
jgi:hypothetical protein